MSPCYVYGFSGFFFSRYNFLKIQQTPKNIDSFFFLNIVFYISFASENNINKGKQKFCRQESFIMWLNTGYWEAKYSDVFC